jgi:phenylpropionate dioxygenase-like ring-hydroxylating dioxygenase large terminal subunit
MSQFWKFGPPLPPVELPETSHAPDWQQAKPAAIARALKKALERPHGNWYVVDASRRLGEKPRRFRIAGEDLVAWRVNGEALMAPDACPHLGASLSDACVRDGNLICPWHGLALGKEGHGGWKPYAVHDDGVLTWVRLGDEDPETPKPVLPPRPEIYLEGVVRLEVHCDAEDVIANRLDPWHGAHFHPYSFASLSVLELDDDVLKVRVAKKLVGRLVVETDATFHSPEPRTIVMTIVEGEGKGSVVETHATPIEPGRTAVVEATLATSDREGFRHALKVNRFIRPLIERSARRLWVDDAAYAERLYTLRNGRSG